MRTITNRLFLALTAGLILAGVVSGNADAGPDAGLSRAIGLFQDTDPESLREAADRAVRAGTDSALLAELVRRFKASGATGPEVLTVLRRAERLASQDLPVSPVLSRYLEGLSKGVPVFRIERVVESLEARLGRAAEHVDGVVGALSQDADQARLIAIDHAAYALEAGVSPHLLENTLTLAAQETDPLEAAQAPVLTLGLLVAFKVEPERSFEVVRSAWAHGYRGDDLESLGKALGRLSQGGQGPPAEAVDQVLVMIGNDTAMEQVFEGLDELMGRGDGRWPAESRPEDTPPTRRGPDIPTNDPGEQIIRDQDRFNADG